MAKPETFSSRWGLIAAGIGMAVGVGNLWRFPRIAAQNGGAAFLIPWVIFLFIWSLPLLMAEFGLGRGARRGVVGAFTTLVGTKFAWMGGFIALTSVMILFYYSVVTGWTLKYFVATLTGQLQGVDAGAYWETYSASIWQPILFHVIAVLIGAIVVGRGVVRRPRTRSFSRLCRESASSSSISRVWERRNMDSFLAASSVSDARRRFSSRFSRSRSMLSGVIRQDRNVARQ